MARVVLRAFGHFGATIALVVVFVLALVAGVLLHLDTSSARATVQRLSERALAAMLPGDVQITDLSVLELDELRVGHLRIRDPEGFVVIDARGLAAELALLPTVKNLIAGKGLVIHLPSVTVDDAQVSLASNDADELRIAAAFASDEPTSETDGASPLIELPRIRIERLRVIDLPLAGEALALDLRGDVRSGETLAITLDRATIVSQNAAFPLVVMGVSGRLRLVDEQFAGEARLAGLAGAVPLSLAVRLSEDERVSGAVHLGPAGARALERWGLPGEGLLGQLLASAWLDGDLSEPRLRANLVHLRPGKESARVQIQLAAATTEPMSAIARLRFERLDLGDLQPSLPATRLAGHAALSLRLEDETPTGAVRLRLEPALVDGHASPATAIDARYDGRTIFARLALEGLIADLRYAEERLTAAARFDRFDLGKLPAVVADLDGRVDGTAQAVVSFDPFRIEQSQLDLTAEKLRLPSLEAASLRIVGSVAGAPDDLRGEAELEARGIRAAGQGFSRASATIRGRDGALEVVARGSGEGPIGEVSARATIDLDEMRLHDPVVSAELRGIELEGSAATLGLDGGIDLREGRIRGLGGDVEVSFRQSPGGLEIFVDAPALELARLDRLIGARLDLGGTAALKAKLTRRGRHHEGRVRLSLEAVRVATIRDLEGHLEAELDGRTITALGRLGWGDLGTFYFELSPLTLARLDPSDLAGWKGATGRADVRLDLDLQELETLTQARLIGRDALPFSELSGRAIASARIEREGATDPPSVDLSLSTEGLSISGSVEPPSQFLSRLPGASPSASIPRRIEGIDLWVQLALDGRSEEAELELRLTDRHGGLFWLDADARLPYAELWRTRGLGDPAAWLPGVKLDAWAHTDRRRIDELPAALGLGDAKGTVRAQGYFSGSFGDPKVGLEVELSGVKAAALPMKKPIDASLVASWKGKTATADARIESDRIRLLDARAELEAELVDLLRRDDTPWRATARAEMCSVPLDLVEPLADIGIGGLVTGRVELHDLGTPAVRLDAQVQGDQLRFGRTIFKAANLDLEANDGRFALVARLDQQRGGARIEASAPLDWKETVPRLSPDEALRIDLRADNFRIAVLEPFVDDILVHLDGRLDADATLELGPQPKLRGRAGLSHGRFQLASFGETFFDAKADMRFEEDGRVRLVSFEARSLEGRLEGEGEAKLNGVGIAHAKAELRIVDELPLLIEGQNFGTAEGHLRLEAHERGDGYVIDLDVAKLLVQLSRSLPEGVQALEPSHKIRVGTVRQGRFFAIPLSPPEEPSDLGTATPILVRVNLGDVEIRQGQTLRAYLGGGPRIELTDQLRVEGAIVIEGGSLEVQGKRFELERSTITFTGRAPDNPDIMATAVWTAPDGTKVFADYVGPLKTGKVELRSDPPLSKNEIVALLLFGDPGGATANTGASASGGGTAGQAVGLGGGIVAEGLNEAISDLTSLDLRAKVSTDRSGGPATELELQLSRSISFAIAHVLGLGQPGQIPDRNFAIIEWRFRRKWSFEASVGDHGSTSFDVLWQHRY